VALGRAFANLIDNAIKYGGEAGVHLEDRAADVVITVADRGPGIPADQREQVFAPFFRLEESRSRETGGTGLGLALARNIVRGHGGDITLEDRDGGGLVARVVLPKGTAG
jgi:signal transduction histidine kinase